MLTSRWSVLSTNSYCPLSDFYTLAKLMMVHIPRTTLWHNLHVQVRHSKKTVEHEKVPYILLFILNGRRWQDSPTHFMHLLVNLQTILIQHGITVKLGCMDLCFSVGLSS